MKSWCQDAFSEAAPEFSELRWQENWSPTVHHISTSSHLSSWWGNITSNAVNAEKNLRRKGAEIPFLANKKDSKLEFVIDPRLLGCLKFISHGKLIWSMLHILKPSSLVNVKEESDFQIFHSLSKWMNCENNIWICVIIKYSFHGNLHGVPQWLRRR